MDLDALRDKAADLAGQTADIGGQMFTPTRVAEALNDAGEWMWMRAKKLNNGWSEEESILNVVDAVLDVALPSNFEHRILQVAYGNVGINFNNTPPVPGNHTILDPAESNYGAEREYQMSRFTGVSFYKYLFTSANVHTIRLIGPPSATQTGGLQVRHETGWTLLVSGTDTPRFPVEHHRLICYKAAKLLRGTQGLDTPIEVEEAYRDRLEAFDEGMVEILLDLEHRIPTAGLRFSQRSTRTGQIRRRRTTARDVF